MKNIWTSLRGDSLGVIGRPPLTFHFSPFTLNPADEIGVRGTILCVAGTKTSLATKCVPLSVSPWAK